MTRALNSTCQSAIWIILCGQFVWFTGCGGPNSVDAVPRTSSNQPVFIADEPRAAVEPSNSLDLSFVHEDHFACVSINVENVISNSDLSDVPWDAIESQLAKLIGPDNSSIKNIERAWVLVDRDGLSSDDDSEPKSPLVFVLDFKTIANETELMETVQKSDEESGNNGVSLVATKIGKNRIVIGSQSLASKISSASGDTSLSRQLKQMKLDGDIDGLVEMGPIRNMLKSVFGVIGSFGGEEAAKLSRLPDALQRVEISLSLESKEMLQAVAYNDDDVLANELADPFNDGDSSGAPTMMGGGIPFGLGGPGVGGQETMMITPTSADVITEVSKEIADKGLFSVEGKDRKLTFKLERPSKLKELIAASLKDAERQIKVAARVEKLKRIASALEAYEEKYKCFPPSGEVSESDAGLPLQFNWRVGLLPFLDEQALYDQFDFSKPWDSPENQEVAKQMPKVFAAVSADERTEPSTETRWHVVGGKLGLFKGERTPKISDISDKKIWTVLVIEGGQNTAVNWTKPGSLQIDAADLEQFGLEHENGILFLNAAFDTRIIKKERQFLHDVLTPDGNEQMHRKDFLPILPGG
jgi:hypothetical protein